MNRLSFALLLFCIPCFAFDPALLTNDKEAETHAYTARQKTQAEERLQALDPSGGLAAQAYAVLGQSTDEIGGTGICELNLIKTFSAALQKIDPRASEQTIEDLLILWRSQDAIDDLFFHIVKQSMDLEQSLSKGAWTSVRSTDSTLTDDQLKRLFAPYKGASRTNAGCTTRFWPGTVEQIQQMTRSKSERTLQAVLVAAHERGQLPDDTFEMLEIYRSVGVQDWTLTLNNYLDILERSKNRNRPDTVRPLDLERNELSSQLVHKRGSTYREELYSKFSPAQINLLSDTLKKMFERTDATRADVVFQLQSGPESIPLSPMGQYYVARKLLKKDMDDLQASGLFAGTTFTYEDLVTAGLETGLVTASLVEAALKIDDLWNPKVESWKKLKNYAMQVVGTGTLFLPPPYNMISTIGLVLINGFIQKHKHVRSEGSYELF